MNIHNTQFRQFGATCLIPLWAMLIPIWASAGTHSPTTGDQNNTYTYSHERNTSSTFSQAQLDQLLSPIALYPDTVLAHVLIAATYPLELVQAERWSAKRNSPGGQGAVDNVGHKPWDPSVKALVAFPDLLTRMVEDLDWTQDLGEAFLVNEEAVMGTVQYLRQQAYRSGHLDQSQHLKVIKQEKVIYIEPVEERIVYLPYYNPRVVYGHWRWASHHPIYWHHPRANVSVGFSWGHRVALSSSFYLGAIHWPHKRVVVVNRPLRLPRYSGRYVAGHKRAKHWKHNPKHRRSVAYRHNAAHRLFGDLRHQRHLNNRAGHLNSRLNSNPKRSSLSQGHHHTRTGDHSPYKHTERHTTLPRAAHHLPKTRSTLPTPKPNKALSAKDRQNRDRHMTNRHNTEYGNKSRQPNKPQSQRDKRKYQNEYKRSMTSHKRPTQKRENLREKRITIPSIEKRREMLKSKSHHQQTQKQRAKSSKWTERKRQQPQSSTRNTSHQRQQKPNRAHKTPPRYSQR